jgi:hypothetical protein
LYCFEVTDISYNYVGFFVFAEVLINHLFAFQDYPEQNIPNTTNHLDGGVNPKIKKLVYDHRGLNKTRRNKLIEVLVWSLGKK